MKIYPDCLEFSLLDELPIQGLRLSSSRLFANSRGLGLQTPGHIHTPVGHACRASGVTSETLWFSLGPWGTQFTIRHLEEESISGHKGLVVREAVIDMED